MRILPIVTALLVVAALYGLIFERDRIIEFSAGLSAQSAPESTDETPPAQAQEVVAIPEEAPERTAVSVRAVVLQSEAIEDDVLLRGRTEADRKIDVRAETGGLVVSAPLPKGTAVTQGQLLCRLEEGTRSAQRAEALARLAQARASLPSAEAALPEAAARVAEAEARLEEARINDNAARELVQDGFATETRVAATKAAVSSAEAALTAAKSGVAAAQAGLEAAQASISSAEAAVALVEKDIERLDIKAPFSGMLESDTAELGSLMQPGSLCGTVIALDPIRLVGFVPEANVDKIAVGAMAGAELINGQQVVGTVTFLSRSADENTRTFRTEITVPNPDLAIRDGQTIEIGIAGDGQQAHLVPQSSLTLDNEGNIGVRTVLEQEGGPVAHFMPVTVLRDTVDGVYVGGLPEEVALITVGQEYVGEGTPVAPTYGELSQ